MAQVSVRVVGGALEQDTLTSGLIGYASSVGVNLGGGVSVDGADLLFEIVADEPRKHLDALVATAGLLVDYRLTVREGDEEYELDGINDDDAESTVVMDMATILAEQ